MSQEFRTLRTSNKKKKNRRRILKWVVTPLLVLVISIVTYGTTLYNKAESVVNKSYKPVETASKRVEKVDPKFDNISLLLIGIDDSETRDFGKGTRSDALMVLTLNKKENTVKIQVFHVTLTLLFPEEPTKRELTQHMLLVEQN